MDYLPPVACVELSADRFYICLIDVNGAADLPRQLGGWTVERDDRELLQRLLSGRLVVKTTDDPMPEVDQAEVAGYFTVSNAGKRTLYFWAPGTEDEAMHSTGTALMSLRPL